MSWPLRGMRSGGASVPARRSVRGRQAHTHAPNTVQVARICCRLAELAPQPGQVHVDRPVATPVGLAPHVREQLTLRNHLSGSLRESEAVSYTHLTLPTIYS